MAVLKQLSLAQEMLTLLHWLLLIPLSEVSFQFNTFLCACSFRPKLLSAILRPRMSTGSVCVELHCGTVLGDEF